MLKWDTAWRARRGEAGLRGLRFHDLRQHAGSRIMPGSSVGECFSRLSRSIQRLPNRHNPAVLSAAALEPGTEETCWISSWRIATVFGVCDRGFLASILTHSRSISPRADTLPRPLAHS